MHTTLHRGSKGRAVLLVQRELKRTVAPSLGVDGDFGKETEDAVHLFQQTVGFTGKDVDGKIGEKTALALTQTFRIKLHGRVRFKPKSTIPSFGLPPLRKPDLSFSSPRVNLNPPAYSAPIAKQQMPGAVLDKEVPSTFCSDKLQCNFQLGTQYSKRDHFGYQFLIGGTLKVHDYYPKTAKKTFYSGANASLQPAFTFGFPFPNPVGGVVTGQFGITVQPLTDFLVFDHLHLLTPSLGAGGQGPFNPGKPVQGMDDTATHPRFGGFLGLELFHYDLPNGFSVGVSGQEALYYDYTDHRMHWDPSVMGFFQKNIGGD